uniref:Uncharacterized protein n=1 Tax=Caenorhabditis japonica TaxID=281687 RepID=A0A8R1HS34_CAEJA
MYMKYMDDLSSDIINPRIASEEKAYEEMRKQCEEYAKLKFTCQRLLSDAPRVAEGKTEIGQKIFMNIEVRDTKHVIVKLSDDVLVEMTLQDAVKVCDRKTDMLKNMMEKTENTINRLKSDLTIMLASMDMPSVEPFKMSLPPDFPFRQEFK